MKATSIAAHEQSFLLQNNLFDFRPSWYTCVKPYHTTSTPQGVNRFNPLRLNEITFIYRSGTKVLVGLIFYFIILSNFDESMLYGVIN